MDISNKEMDQRVEIASAMERLAVENRANNDSDYVAGRVKTLYGSGRTFIPVAAGVIDSQSRLSFLPRSNWCAGENFKGVVIRCRDFATGEVGSYLAESDGSNGVVITRRVAE